MAQIEVGPERPIPETPPGSELPAPDSPDGVVEARTERSRLRLPRVRLGSLSFLQALFYIYLISMLGVMTFLIPPLLKADEPAHYHRAVSITNGQFACPHDEQGYYVEMKQKYADLPNVLHTWDVWILRDVKFDTNWLNVDWSDPRFDEKTRIYEYCNLPVVGYPVAALGILVAKPFENPLIGFYLARTLGAIVFVLAVIYSLKITPARYKPLVYFYAALPIVLHQVSAISYDVIQLSLFPILFGMITKFAVENELINRKQLLLFFLLVLWSINIRLLSYTPLLLLAFAIKPSNVSVTMSGYVRTMACFVLGAVAITAALILVHLPRVAGGYSPTGISAKGQIEFMTDHPLKFLEACYRTLDQQGEWILKQSIAVFGWTDTPVSYFVFFGVVFAAGIVIYRTAERDELNLGRMQIFAILAAVSATIVMLFVSLYAVWSPVGNGSVDGLQGRYFIGLLPFLAYGLSQLAIRVGRLRFVQAVIVAATIGVFANIVRTLDLRYYG